MIYRLFNHKVKFHSWQTIVINHPNTKKIIACCHPWRFLFWIAVRITPVLSSGQRSGWPGHPTERGSSFLFEGYVWEYVHLILWGYSWNCRFIYTVHMYIFSCQHQHIGLHDSMPCVCTMYKSQVIMQQSEVESFLQRAHVYSASCYTARHPTIK